VEGYITSSMMRAATAQRTSTCPSNNARLKSTRDGSWYFLKKRPCFPLKFGVLFSLIQVRKRSYGLECCSASSFPHFCDTAHLLGMLADREFPSARRRAGSCVCGAETLIRSRKGQDHNRD